MREVYFARHRHLGGRPRHAELGELHRAALEARHGVDAVEAKALGEDIAEVERDAPRQRLQVHERDQLAQARIDLEELAVLGAELEIAREARIIERHRLAQPANRAGELGLAAEHGIRIADAREELADVGGFERELELARGRRAAAPAAVRAQGRIGIGHRQLLDAPVLAVALRGELHFAELLAAQVEAFGAEVDPRQIRRLCRNGAARVRDRARHAEVQQARDQLPRALGGIRELTGDFIGVQDR